MLFCSIVVAASLLSEVICHSRLRTVIPRSELLMDTMPQDAGESRTDCHLGSPS